MPEALPSLPLVVPLQTRIAPAGVPGGTQTTATITDPGILDRLDSALINAYASGDGHVQKRPGIEEVAKLLPSVRPRGVAEISGSTADFVLAICDDVLMVNPEPGIKTGERWLDLGLTLPTINTSPLQVKLVSFGSVILAIDGPEADVYSTTNGITWTLLTTAAGWTAREKFGVVATSTHIYVIGGHSGATDRTDVWRSADGITWVQRSTAIPTSGGDIAGSRDPLVVANVTDLYWGFGGTNASPNGDSATLDHMFKSTDGGGTVGHGTVSLAYDLDARLWYAWNVYGPQSLGAMGTVTRTDDATGYARVRFTHGAVAAADQPIAGDLIEVRGAVPTAYNGEWIVDLVIDSTHFEVLIPTDPGVVTTTGIINILRNVPSLVSPAAPDHGVSLRFPISHSAFQLPPGGVMVSDAASLSLAFPPNIGQTTAASVFPILARASSSAFLDEWTGRPTAEIGASVQLANRSHIEYMIRTAKWDGGNNSKKSVLSIDVVGDQCDAGVKAWLRHTDDDRRSFSSLTAVDMDNNRPRTHRQGATRRRVYDVRCSDTSQTAKLERLEAFIRTDGQR